MDFEPSSILDENPVKRPQIFKINPSRLLTDIENGYSDFSKVQDESENLNVKLIHLNEISALTVADNLQEETHNFDNETFISILEDLKDISSFSQLNLTETKDHTRLENTFSEFSEFIRCKKKTKHYQRILNVIKEEEM